MSKYRKLSHCFYYCVYHIVWTPKYRLWILRDVVADAVEDKIRVIRQGKDVAILKLNVQRDHLHLACDIRRTFRVSEFMGILKGKTATMMFKSYSHLRQKPYWGNYFWSL